MYVYMYMYIYIYIYIHIHTKYLLKIALEIVDQLFACAIRVSYNQFLYFYIIL